MPFAVADHVPVSELDDVSELLSGARAETWAVRAEAGRQLARHAGNPTVDVVLDGLLLDPADTGVSVATAEALLERRDVIGLRVYLSALSRADDDTGYHLRDSLSLLMQTRGDVDDLQQRLRDLRSDEDPSVRAGATEVAAQVGDL